MFDIRFLQKTFGDWRNFLPPRLQQHSRQWHRASEACASFKPLHLHTDLPPGKEFHVCGVDGVGLWMGPHGNRGMGQSYSYSTARDNSSGHFKPTVQQDWALAWFWGYWDTPKSAVCLDRGPRFLQRGQRWTFESRRTRRTASPHWGCQLWRAILRRGSHHLQNHFWLWCFRPRLGFTAMCPVSEIG